MATTPRRVPETTRSTRTKLGEDEVGEEPGVGRQTRRLMAMGTSVERVCL
jgi:hypothetical protein